MLIRAKIENQTVINQKYFKLYQSIFNENTNRNIFKVNLKQLSCNLCFRFFNEPVMHSSCKTIFCKICLLEWVKYFGFCKTCKCDLSFENVQSFPIQEDLWNIIKIIEIECRFGACSKNFKEIQLKKKEKWKKKLINDLPPIEENSCDFDSVHYPSHIDLKEKSYFKMMEEGESAMISSRRNNRMNFSLATSNGVNVNRAENDSEERLNESFSNLLRNSLKKDKKRNFKVSEYDYHIINQHHWPALNIQFGNSPNDQPLNNKNIKKICYAGYKNNKKCGPGVMYIIKKGRTVETYMGPFADDLSDDHGTILRDNKLIYEGELKKGNKHGIGTERWYFDLPEEELNLVIEPKDKTCYLEYKGKYKKGMKQGHGELYFFGNFSLFKKYFKHLKLKNCSNNNDGDFYNTMMAPNPEINSIIKEEVDPDFNSDELFRVFSNQDLSQDNINSDIHTIKKPDKDKNLSSSKP